MGMDIYSEQGVIVSIDEMLGMLRKKDLKPVLQACLNFFHDYSKHDFWTQSSTSFEDFFEPIRSLQEVAKPTLEQVQEALNKVCVVNGEPSKYGSDDCFVHHADALCHLWQNIVAATRPELPDLNEIRVFASGRVNGWDVPHGVACFIFSDTECYEKVLTDQGKALKKAVGHCDSSEWTIMSV